MRVPAPSNERAQSESFRREECSRLFLLYLSWATDMLASYRYLESNSRMERLCRQFVEDGEARIDRIADKRGQKILRDRFIERRIVPEIAEEYGMSSGSIHFWCRDGLRELYDYLPEEWQQVYGWSKDAKE